MLIANKYPIVPDTTFRLDEISWENTYGDGRFFRKSH